MRSCVDLKSNALPPAEGAAVQRPASNRNADKWLSRGVAHENQRAGTWSILAGRVARPQAQAFPRNHSAWQVPASSGCYRFLAGSATPLQAIPHL